MKLDNIEDIYELSPVQEALLATEQADEAVGRCAQLSCVLVGRLVIADFKWAWQQVLNRHATLRTSFLWKRIDKPVQIVNRELVLPLDTHDWQSLSTEQQLKQFNELRRGELTRGMNPATPPLVRLALCRTSEDASYLVCTYHPLILDEQSVRLMLREVVAYYESAGNGCKPQLPPGNSFRAYVNWVKRQDAHGFWSRSLKDFHGQPSLERYPRSYLANQIKDQDEGGYDEERMEFSAESLTSVRELADRHQLRFETVMQGAWALLLNRETGGEDIVYGLLNANRPAEPGTLLGPLSNTLPVRVQVPPGQPVISWLKSLESQLTELRQYNYCSLDQIRQWSGVSAEQQLFQSVIVAEELLDDSLETPGSSLKIQPIDVSELAGIPVVVRLPHPAKPRLRISYDPQFLTRETVQQILAHFQTLLAGVIAGPERPILNLPILSAAEEEQVLDQWNQTTTAYPRQSCIHELFEQQAGDRPNAIAAVYEDKQLTYGELNRRANQLARHLQLLGVETETPVALCVERGLDMLVGMLGVLKAGGAYVPLDPTHPLERLAFMLEDLQAPVVLTEQRLLEKLPAQWGHVICLDTDWETISLQSQENPTEEARAENLAYVMYTSGSTGTPKGVSVTHRAVVRLVRETNYVELSSEEVVLQFAPISFDASTFEIWGSLLNGGRLAVMPPLLRSFDTLGEALRKYEVTTLWLTAGLFHMMVDVRLDDFQGVRQLLAGGDSLSLPHVRRAFERLPECRLINGYGPTEGTTFTCCYPIVDIERLRSSVPIGRPISNTQVFILDNYLRAVPAGVTGELYIAGDGLARDYHNRPALTAERFIPNPYGDTPGARLYKTGDLARYLPDGNIEFLGRRDLQVKVRGFRIEPGEIEAALRIHPSVEDVAVVARADISGEKQLVAYVVAAEQTAVWVNQLRDFLKQKLPDHMVPSAFVTLDALPLTPNGKVDRQALPAPARNRQRSEEFVAPSTATEAVMTVIWSQALGVDQVGIDDNFFLLGGDSIRGVQVLAKAQELGLSFSLQDLFLHQTIRKLAKIATVTADGAGQSGSTQPFSLISDRDRRKLPDHVEDAYPLTMLQAGMIFHNELSPTVYHDIFSHHVRAPYNPETLRTALAVLARRHAVLRTSFVFEGFSEPLQLVHRAVEIPLEVGDLRDLSPSEQESFLRSQIDTKKNRVFDWGHAPLINVAVHRRTNDSFQFTLSFHHAILDGWSLAAMFAELVPLYFSPNDQLSPAAEAAPLVGFYRDYVALEQKALHSEECRQYWANKLRGSTAMNLRRGSASDREDRDSRVRIDVMITPELSAGLKEVARLASVPLKSVLLAAHLKVMSFISGKSDVTTGLISNGRPEEADGERLLGLFLNTIPFRQQIGGGTWIDLVRQTFLNGWEVLPFRWYPLAQIQREQGGKDLLETAFNFIHFHNTHRLHFRTDIELLDSMSFERTNFPLIANFSLDLGPEDVHLVVFTQVAQFTTESKAIGDYYLRALTLMAEQPDADHRSTSLLSEFELHQLLYDWNSTSSEYPSHGLLPELFEQQVAAAPNRIAVEFGDNQLTYGELNKRANQLAHYLSDLGVGPEVRVGICLERSIEMLVGVLGVLKAGGAYVPLDPAYPAEHLSFMLHDAQVSVLLLQQKLVERLSSDSAAVVLLDADWERIAQESEANPPARAIPENLAYVIYTSGSTGRPKGVAICHRSVVGLLRWASEVFSPSALSAVLASTSICFDLSVFELFVPLANGGKLILVQNALALSDLPQGSAVTLINTVPSAMGALLRMGSVPESARTVNLAGEPLTAALVQRVFRETGAEEVYNLYGPSEDTTYATFVRITRDESGEPTIGQPIANTQVYLLDEHMYLVPVGVPGELYIGGDGLARGYLGQAALTAERFVPDHCSGKAGGRLYRTGDLARYRADGQLEFLGRMDHQVKVRGFRIELGEIEARLLEQGTLREAVVVARQEETDDTRLVAYVVANSETGNGAGPTPEKLRGYLQGSLPEYMVPAAFVVLPELPLTPSGKVDRRALPVPGREALAVSALAGAVPRTEIQQLIHALWSAVLKVEGFGIHDNFFALGGHSLLATQVITRMRAALQMQVPVRAMFTHPTVAELARWVERAMRDESSGAPPLQRADRTGPLPLSFAQQRLWFIDQLAPGSAVYNMPLAVRLRGPLDAKVLERVVNEIVRRHEVLRTSFGVVEDEPVQVIAGAQTLELPVEDLTELEEREELVLRLVNKEAREPFDLGRGPLLRARLLRLGEEDHVAMLTMHHVISDGWSLGVLLREVALLYGAFMQGKTSPLPELEIQYADYAVWQREWLQGEELGRQLAYWRKQLSGAPAVLELPKDHARPAVQTHQGATEPFVLGAEVSEGVRQVSREAGTTTFMVLLAAWQALLKGLSGVEDISVGTAVAGRTQAELEPLIGFFVNTLVLRTDLSGDPTFAELLERVREVCVGAYGHQEAPFEKLVDELAPVRSLAHTPLFQVMVVMQQQAEHGELEGIGLAVSGVGGEVGSAKYDLTLYVREAGGVLGGALEYNTDIFARERAQRMMEQWQRLLAAAVAEPERRISGLPLLSETERQQLADDSSKALPQLFEPRVQRTPEAGQSFVAPRDVLELGLAQIWEDVLGVKPIGVKDNFFALGGHSFLAVRLMSRIKERTGKSLPLALLIREPTIESLASELRRDLPLPSPLVAIRREGSAPAFFCVHPAGGNVLCYAALAHHLGPERPFYGFQARGLENGDEPFTSIEAAASHYMAEMRAIQPEGPYLIGGWSTGGLIAFEMARLLRVQQQQIALLALFDSHLDYEKATEEDEATLLIKSALHLGLPLEHLPSLREGLRTLNPEAQLDFALDHINRLNLLPPDVEDLQIRNLIRVFKANLQAARDYSPRPGYVRITLFKASEPLGESTPALAARWLALALDGVEVREIPGDHFTMMREPHVRVLAEHLNDCLRHASDHVEHNKSREAGIV